MSFVVIDSHDLFNWCETVINTITSERSRLWDSMVKERLAYLNRPRFLDWLWARNKVYTEQDAVDSLCALNELCISDSDYVDNLHSGALEVAYRLKGATEFGSRVHVDTRDLVTLKSYRNDL